MFSFDWLLFVALKGRPTMGCGFVGLKTDLHYQGCILSALRPTYTIRVVFCRPKDRPTLSGLYFVGLKTDLQFISECRILLPIVGILGHTVCGLFCLRHVCWLRPCL